MCLFFLEGICSTKFCLWLIWLFWFYHRSPSQLAQPFALSGLDKKNTALCPGSVAFPNPVPTPPPHRPHSHYDLTMLGGKGEKDSGFYDRFEPGLSGHDGGKEEQVKTERSPGDHRPQRCSISERLLSQRCSSVRLRCGYSQHPIGTEAWLRRHFSPSLTALQHFFTLCTHV